MREISFGTFVFLTKLLSLTTPAVGQEVISTITFESVPEQVSISAPAITLEGSASVEGDLEVAGSIDVGPAGLNFPDGTSQNTANSTDPISSFYSNQIVDITPPAAYSEICFKSGTVQIDIHSVSEPTAGGNCVAGDRGWIIERDERSAETWDEARVDCLVNEMRLPEFFEWRYSCVRAGDLGLSDMNNSWEWATNIPLILDSNRRGPAATIAGNAGCGYATWGWLSTSDATVDSFTYRCAR